MFDIMYLATCVLGVWYCTEKYDVWPTQPVRFSDQPIISVRFEVVRAFLITILLRDMTPYVLTRIGVENAVLF